MNKHEYQIWEVLRIRVQDLDDDFKELQSRLQQISRETKRIQKLILHYRNQPENRKYSQILPLHSLNQCIQEDEEDEEDGE
jgi:hypothetical protein